MASEKGREDMDSLPTPREASRSASKSEADLSSSISADVEAGVRQDGLPLSATKARIAPPTLRAFPKMRLWLGVLVGALFLFLALRNIRFADLLGVLTQANALFLIAALGSVLATSLAKTIRWKLLFFPRHRGLHLDRLFSVLLIGQTVNSVLPARLGEIARAYLVGELNKVSKSWTLGTIIVEKALDSMMLLLVMAALVPFVSLPVWLRSSALILAAALAFLFLLLIFLAPKRDQLNSLIERTGRYIPLSKRLGLSEKITLALQSLEPLKDWRAMAGLLLLSLIVWALALSTNALTFAAMNMNLPLWVSALLLVVLQVGSSIPTSPGRIGVFHYLCILTLSLVAVDRSRALGFALVLHLIVYAPMIILGTLFMWKESLSLQRLASLRASVVAESK